MPAKLLVATSHGADNALGVTAAYLAAVAGVEQGRETALWLSSDAVRLATEGYCDTIRAAPGAPAVRDLHARLTEGGARIFVCDVSLAALTATDDAPLVESAEVARASRVLEWAGDDALSVSF
jgi:predicted peroxiredoxin